MKILLTGAHGQVAHDIIQQNKHTLVALSRQQFDITNTETVNETLAHHQADIVINTAAYTAVDKAEVEKDRAFLVNSTGAGLLAKACADLNTPLIHLSTDYVFDGTNRSPYFETDKTNPINAYGESKLSGECEVRQELERHIILRVTGVFGVHGNNFVKTMLQLGEQRESLSIINDQTVCPTAAADIATTVLTIAEKINAGANNWGTYHYCSNKPTTWLDFADAIFKATRQHRPLKLTELNPISTAEFGAPATRPLYSVLNCDKIRAVFGIEQPDWQLRLASLIKKLV